MGYRERQRQERAVDSDLDAASPLRLIGQLLWLGLRRDIRTLYGLLIFVPRFYLTLRFSRRMRQISERMAAQQEFQRELMALLVEKKFVKPDAKSK